MCVCVGNPCLCAAVQIWISPPPPPAFLKQITFLDLSASLNALFILRCSLALSHYAKSWLLEQYNFHRLYEQI